MVDLQKTVKKSANIWLYLQNGFEATLDPGGLFKLKLSKNEDVFYKTMRGAVSYVLWLLLYLSWNRIWVFIVLSSLLCTIIIS